VGEYFETDVINKVGEKTITVFPALTKTFSPDDPVHFTRNFFVFSDTAPSNLPGALYKFRAKDSFPLALNVSNMFNLVRATTFFKNKLMFVRGGEIIWFNPDSQTIFKSQAIDNLDEDRGEYHAAFDLAGFSDEIYRLEQKKTTYNVSLEKWETANWSPLFNYNTSSVVPEVYFVAVKAEPPLLHRFDDGIAIDDLTSLITVIVLDQFRTPVKSTTSGNNLNMTLLGATTVTVTVCGYEAAT